LRGGQELTLLRNGQGIPDHAQEPSQMTKMSCLSTHATRLLTGGS